MKKYLTLCIALVWLYSCPLYSQESENVGPSAELSVIPTFDGVFGIPMGGGNLDFNLGNSSFYSLFEGRMSKSLIFSMSFHWASFELDEGKFNLDAFSDLYNYTGRSDNFTWLDWAYMGWEKDNFSVIVGKNTLFGCGMEGDDYDWDIHPTLVSSIWNNFQPYQWAVDTYYTSNSENTTLGLQVGTTPYAELPLTKGCYSLAFNWRGEYGPLRNNWTFSYIGTGDGYYPLLSLGQAVDVSDNFSIILDYWNTVCDPENLFTKGHSAYLSALWCPSDKWELKAIGGTEFCDYELNVSLQGKYMGGLAVHWLPVERLRIHCTFAANQMQENSIYAAIGVQYKMNLHIGR